MATPTDVSYSTPSGTPLYVGRPDPRWPAARSTWVTGIIGDSLQRNYTSNYMSNAMLGGIMTPRANAGRDGQSMSGLAAQILLDYNDFTSGPGLTDIPDDLDLIILAGGTNVYKGADGTPGVNIDGANEGYFDTYLLRALDLAPYVVILGLIPCSDLLNTQKPRNASWNDYFIAKAAANPTRVFYNGDANAGLVDGNGDIIPRFYLAGDRIHPSAVGQYEIARLRHAWWTKFFMNQSLPSPLVTDPAHVYPAFDQWGTNPTMTGTGGTKGSGWTGTVPDGFRVESNGSGVAGAVSIVGGKMRITPSAMQSGSAISITQTAAGVTVDSGNPGLAVETLIEITPNNLVGIGGMDMWMQVSGGTKLTDVMSIQLDDTGVNSRLVARLKHDRRNTGATGTPTIYMYVGGATGTPTGSFDIAFQTVEG